MQAAGDPNAQAIKYRQSAYTVLAAQFGYMPGALWILIGCVLAGGVHDMVVLFASVRHKGRSLSMIAETEIGKTTGKESTRQYRIAYADMKAVGGLVQGLSEGIAFGLETSFPEGSGYVLRLFTDDLVLTPDEAAGLRAVPGVEAIDFRTTYQTRLRIGDRREDVLLVGVEDFARRSIRLAEYC